MAEFIITDYSFGRRWHFDENYSTPGEDFDGTEDKTHWYSVDDRIITLYQTWEVTSSGEDGNLAGIIADCMSEYVPRFQSKRDEKVWFALRDWMHKLFTSGKRGDWGVSYEMIAPVN